MTIRKGEPWGAVGPAPDDVQLARSDAELHAIVNRCRSAESPLPAVGLLGGDLCRAVGGTGDAARFEPRSGAGTGGQVAILPVDLLRVELGGSAGQSFTRWAACHVLVRRTAWRGPIVAVMGTQYLGRWDVAPRAHPNDGRADVVEVDAQMPWRERWQAWRRLPRGAHVPHPLVRTRQVRDFEIDVPPGTHVWLDGQRLREEGLARVARVRVVVEPDALRVCV